MNQQVEHQLSYLGLSNLQSRWQDYFKEIAITKASYQQFLTTIIADEYSLQVEIKRTARIKAAVIPDLLVMESFPFDRQPQLKKRMVMELYDSQTYISEAQVLVFIGPTGCGKTGLATSFLVNAINKECRGRFVDFKDLLRQLYASLADRREKNVLKHFAAYDCLLIDEVGYTVLDKMQAGLFFDLIKMRHKKKCTIITSQLGFDDWDSFVNDRHLCAALLGRITENCTIFNMSKCISIRPKRIAHATEKQKQE